MENTVTQPGQGGSPRIVIVEDNPEVRNVLTLLVQKYGYGLCGVADSGEDAIGIIRETSPDLVFIDIVLEGPMDGIELAHHINKEFKIPFIYITAYAWDNMIERVIHTSPAAFILKPFRGEEIRVAVDLAMKRTSLKKA